MQIRTCLTELPPCIIPIARARSCSCILIVVFFSSILLFKVCLTFEKKLISMVTILIILCNARHVQKVISRTKHLHLNSTTALHGKTCYQSSWAGVGDMGRIWCRGFDAIDFFQSRCVFVTFHI